MAEEPESSLSYEAGSRVNTGHRAGRGGDMVVRCASAYRAMMEGWRSAISFSLTVRSQSRTSKNSRSILPTSRFPKMPVAIAQ